MNHDESFIIDPVLDKTFNAISDIHGFYFGRFDIRVKNIDDFVKTGKYFKILEVNVGAQTMALQALDPKYSFFQKYAIFAKQIAMAFKISQENLEKKSLKGVSKKRRSVKEFLLMYVKILRKLKK